MTVTGFEDAFFFFFNKQLSLCVTKKTPHISIAFLKKTQHCSADNEVF